MHPQFLSIPRSVNRTTVAPGHDDTTYANGWHHPKGWTPPEGFGIKGQFAPTAGGVRRAGAVLPGGRGRGFGDALGFEPALCVDRGFAAVACGGNGLPVAMVVD